MARYKEGQHAAETMKRALIDKLRQERNQGPSDEGVEQGLINGIRACERSICAVDSPAKQKLAKAVRKRIMDGVAKGDAHWESIRRGGEMSSSSQSRHPQYTMPRHKLKLPPEEIPVDSSLPQWKVKSRARGEQSRSNRCSFQSAAKRMSELERREIAAKREKDMSIARENEQVAERRRLDRRAKEQADIDEERAEETWHSRRTTSRARWNGGVSLKHTLNQQMDERTSRWRSEALGLPPP